MELTENHVTSVSEAVDGRGVLVDLLQRLEVLRVSFVVVVCDASVRVLVVERVEDTAVPVGQR